MQLMKKFLSPEAGDYGSGYESDEVKTSPFNFGANFGAAKLTKFAFTPTGGKDGAEQDALDIVFTINGTEKNYRVFPINKVYSKNNTELTDPSTKEYQEARVEALRDQKAVVTHILHAFQEDDVVKQALSRPFNSFKEWANACAALIPNNAADIALDIFLQYQWQPSTGQNRTYLEIPKKMKYGAWLKRSDKFVPVGAWKEVKKENPQESDREALYYVDDANNKHPFIKNGWFMLSNFAKVQNVGGSSSDAQAGAAMNSGTNVAAPQTNTPSQAATSW